MKKFVINENQLAVILELVKKVPLEQGINAYGAIQQISQQLIDEPATTAADGDKKDEKKAVKKPTKKK